MKNYIFLSVFGLMLFGSLHCQKPNREIICNNSNIVSIPQRAKDLFVFNSGSFWVYKKINTQERDTITLSSISIASTNYFPHYGGKMKKCYESYRLNYASGQMGDMFIYIDVTAPDDNANIQDLCFFVDQKNPFNVNYIYKKLIFKGDSIFPSIEIESNLTFLDSITITGKTYFHVLEHSLPSKGFEFYTDAFYTSKVGLLRFIRANDNSIWELEDYNLKK